MQKTCISSIYPVPAKKDFSIQDDTDGMLVKRPLLVGDDFDIEMNG